MTSQHPLQEVEQLRPELVERQRRRDLFDGEERKAMTSAGTGEGLVRVRLGAPPRPNWRPGVAVAFAPDGLSISY